LDLLVSKGADINLPGDDSVTPLYLAFQHRNRQKAQWLLGERASKVK
jgi:hypothetical protein